MVRRLLLSGEDRRPVREGRERPRAPGAGRAREGRPVQHHRPFRLLRTSILPNGPWRVLPGPMIASPGDVRAGSLRQSGANHALQKHASKMPIGVRSGARLGAGAVSSSPRCWRQSRCSCDSVAASRTARACWTPAARTGTRRTGRPESGGIHAWRGRGDGLVVGGGVNDLAPGDGEHRFDAGVSDSGTAK